MVSVQTNSSDIRVISSRGASIPHRLLQFGPGERCKLIFPLTKGAHTYYIYYGNPNAPAPPETDWEPMRGLILETRKYAGGDGNNWARMQKAMERSKHVYGRGPAPNIFLGYNPFGPSNNYISIYRGWLLCPINGSYRFSITSYGPSFLLIDGKLVLGWPGWHGLVADARRNKQVNLLRKTAGFYRSQRQGL